MPVIPIEMPGERDYASVQFDGLAAQASQAYPYTTSNQVYDWGGATHRATIQISAKRESDARAWLSFYGRINGVVNTWWLTPPAMLVQTRSAGLVVLDGADQTGKEVLVRGATPSSHEALEAGRMVAIHGRLHTVTEDLVTDATGAGTLHIWPGVATRDLPDGEVVRWRAPRGEFRLLGQPPGAGFPSAANHIGPVSFSGIAMVRRTANEVDLTSEVDR